MKTVDTSRSGKKLLKAGQQKKTERKKKVWKIDFRLRFARKPLKAKQATNESEKGKIRSCNIFISKTFY